MDSKNAAFAICSHSLQHKHEVLAFYPADRAREYPPFQLGARSAALARHRYEK
jgi:hypothetical protein